MNRLDLLCIGRKHSNVYFEASLKADSTTVEGNLEASDY
jgi:hypothetical protein